VGAKSRRKGYRCEAEVVNLHRELGVEARRVPLSGACEGFKGDVEVGPRGGCLGGEVKARANGSGFLLLEKWLGANDLLFVRRNHAAPLVILPWSTWARAVEALAAKEGWPPAKEPA
jgi:Holliday junction resolvase